MCGIAGIYKYDNCKVKKSEIIGMLSKIKHRGPDGQNIFIYNNVGLGHVLLKIQDTTNNSLQPYFFKNLVLIYNGEIYNYVDLRKELILKNYDFITDGDTEVLIKLIDCYGLKKALSKINGCFAFSLYNKKTKHMYLVRDRFGIKPLYYYFDKKRIIFCSEIKGILQCKNIPKKFNIDKVLETFNCRLWLDQKSTLFKKIYCLMPGTYIEISNNRQIFKKYYNLKFNYKYDNVNDLINDFGNEFEKSIQMKLVSKVPIAAFLSGGLDSSIVCKKISDYSSNKLNTYTIYYDTNSNLDLKYANLLSSEENFNSHNILITSNMYNIENIDKVTYGVEEVLMDKVYIPMYFNYKAAHDDGFTVVISGQGSDEVWLGYIFTWKIFTYLNEKYNNDTLINEYYIKNMIFKDKLNEKYKAKIYNVILKYLNNNLNFNKNDQINSYGDLSFKTILHDLLVQEDKIAMMSSVESRVPFVDDHKIVELAYSSPSRLKTFDGREKYIVREYSKGKINESIINRNKYPFPEPPQLYNDTITKLCKDNWHEITNCKIIKLLIKSNLLDNIENFSEVEQWWLLCYWRFEVIFNMEV